MIFATVPFLPAAVFWFTAATATLFIINFLLFQRPSIGRSKTKQPAVSVLIPARNESTGIRATLERVLATEGVELEILVLDDQSTDDTAAIIDELANRPEHENRLHLIAGEPLPDGWCGKQFACHQLAAAATHEHMLFLDADVHLQPHAISFALSGMKARRADLWSGFPRLSTASLGEGLLVPMIYLVLLTYLPMFFMRWTRMKAAAAGCGQFFLTTQSAYDAAGGHASIRDSLHDGVTLPRSYRNAGLHTDLFDARALATCRMYSGFNQSWAGLSKNAHEGIATARRIVPFTVLLFLGYVAPTLVLILHLATGANKLSLFSFGLATILSYLPRFGIALLYDRNWLAALLMPISVTLFLVLQWRAFYAHRSGAASNWRGRSYPPSS